MNQKTLLALRVVLGLLGLLIAGAGLWLSAHGKQGGTPTWMGIALMFFAAFLLIANSTRKK